MKNRSKDVVILGGGIVGLTIANQLINRNITNKITIVEREKKLGLHSSGRNSGVLHSGIYYDPGSLKAKVCVDGAKRLKQWIKERKLPLNDCGKIIIPTKTEQDDQLELLLKRGKKNGATVEMLDENKLKELEPEVRSVTGRAIWSPNTVVVDPKSVIYKLEDELKNKGIDIIKDQKSWLKGLDSKFITLNSGEKIYYEHLINCTGLQADAVAHRFKVGLNFRILPFKGLYWKLKDSCPIKIKRNIYPIPDLNLPFLGVHFTPSAGINKEVSIGPTATPALGRYNYRALEGIEPLNACSNIYQIAKQYFLNKGGFRKYTHEQLFLALPYLLHKSAQELVPSIRSEHIERSKKIGIRSQLYNLNTQKLENDFLCLEGENSTHVLNAISPAFTASFSLADLIINRTPLI